MELYLEACVGYSAQDFFVCPRFVAGWGWGDDKTQNPWQGNEGLSESVISLHGNVRTTDFRVRKRSIPQEISCSFEGTLDLYGII